MDNNHASAEAGAASHRIELTYCVEFADYLAFAKHVPWTVFERLYSMIIPVGAGLLGSLAAIALWVMFEKTFPALAAFDGGIFVALCGLVVYLAMLFKVIPAYLRGIFLGQPMAHGETVMAADAGGVSLSVVAITTSFPWSALVAMRATKSHLFLFYGRLTRAIVPRRAFASDAQYEQLMSILRAQAPSSAI